jgi:hypothetical protein
MPPDRRLLRDIQSAYNGMLLAQLDQGQWCHWFRYNQAASTSHPVYDTGPQRVWYPPITLPIWLGEYQRAGRNFDDDGLYLVDRVHVICSYDAFFHTTMLDPDPWGNDHLRDRVAFDGHIFKVDTFLPRGRVASYFLTISIDLTEVAQSEMAEDGTIAQFTPYLNVADISGGVI